MAPGFFIMGTRDEKGLIPEIVTLVWGLLKAQVEPVNCILHSIAGHYFGLMDWIYPVNALIGRTLLSRALMASAILVNPACWISSTFKELGRSCLLANINTGISAVSWWWTTDSIPIRDHSYVNWRTQGILAFLNSSFIRGIDDKYQGVTFSIILLPDSSQALLSPQIPKCHVEADAVSNSDSTDILANSGTNVLRLKDRCWVSWLNHLQKGWFAGIVEAQNKDIPRREPWRLIIVLIEALQQMIHALVDAGALECIEFSRVFTFQDLIWLTEKEHGNFDLPPWKVRLHCMTSTTNFILASVKLRCFACHDLYHDNLVQVTCRRTFLMLRAKLRVS